MGRENGVSGIFLEFDKFPDKRENNCLAFKTLQRKRSLAEFLAPQKVQQLLNLITPV
jgi:hypothetical protein